MTRVVVYYGTASDITRFDAPEWMELPDGEPYLYVEKGDRWWLMYDRDNDRLGPGVGLHKPRNWRDA